jgi:hypothetical protein
VIVLDLGAVFHLAQHFAITTDSLAMISPHLPWRRDQAKYDAAFPQFDGAIVVVVDGATPELTERGAAMLAAQLSTRTDLFQSVTRADGGPFFARNGLLFRPLAQVEATARQLIAAQPFLGPLAADPSLRGVMDSLSLALSGVSAGQTTLAALEPAISAFAGALENVAAGKPAYFSWRSLIAGSPPSRRETRQIILVRAALNNGALTPGATAASAIRAAAARLSLAPTNGVRVRLTGAVMLADEEYSTLAEHATLMAVLTGAAVLLMLWIAVRSASVIAAIVTTTFSGLILTAALGLLLVGRFNLISLAFVPVFVGLGIDFAIQFSIRYQGETVSHPKRAEALAATGAKAGGSLALAAASIASGFFAFIPTAYLGASELGLIAGCGILIAFLLSLTFLPALLMMAPRMRQGRAGGAAILAYVEARLCGRDRIVVALGCGFVAIALALLPFLQFDFNPLHMRNPKTESVATLVDLMSDVSRSPNAVDVLAPSLKAANDLAERLAQLPEVAGTVTLSSFVPKDQPRKLAVIGDAVSLLDLTVDPINIRAPPTDQEIVNSLSHTAAALDAIAPAAAEPPRSDARRLAVVLKKLAAPNARALRIAADTTLLTPFGTLLAQLRAAVHPEGISLATLPPEIVRDWTTKNGEARIEVLPKGNENDNGTLKRFAAAVRSVAPDASGPPITTEEAARTIVGAFVQAGISSFLAITVLLALVLRRARDVLLTLAPIVMIVVLTLGFCVAIGQPLNFTNIIALPLLFGIGVAFDIYFVVAWRNGERRLLSASVARAVACSALTTVAAFGGLCFSSHPGTASMGLLLIISVAWTLAITLLFQPALLALQKQPR